MLLTAKFVIFFVFCDAHCSHMGTSSQPDRVTPSFVIYLFNFLLKFINQTKTYTQ